MRVIFCADPLTPTYPDPMYEAEADVASRLEMEYDVIDFERLVHDGDPAGATRRVKPADRETSGLYRGWMLRPEHYGMLYDALLRKGIRLINTPEAYRHCHYLPESYEVIEAHTPRTIWIPERELPEPHLIPSLLAPFGEAPLIVKDYVKSRKHEWYEACYIPSAADGAAVTRVVKRLLELQGEELNEGLVFREYIPFRSIGRYSRSGMPITEEFRCFVLDDEFIATLPYWEEGEYGVAAPPPGIFADVARNVRSRFFSMDIARSDERGWMIVELGDGQVAGLPEGTDIEGLYRHMKRLD